MLSNQRIHEFVRIGAEIRVKQIFDELETIGRTFPDLVKKLLEETGLGVLSETGEAHARAVAAGKKAAKTRRRPSPHSPSRNRCTRPKYS